MAHGNWNLIPQDSEAPSFGTLAAFDTQRLKRLHEEAEEYGDSAMASVGALMLHLDFLNIFRSLLRFTGRRK